MNQALITIDTNKSLSADYTSPATPLQQQYAVNIQAIWSGSPVGTFVIQTSLDYSPGGVSAGSVGVPPNAGTWDTYPGSQQSSSGANSCTWDIPAFGARWFRVKYTSSSGSGTLTKLLAEIK